MPVPGPVARNAPLLLDGGLRPPVASFGGRRPPSKILRIGVSINEKVSLGLVKERFENKGKLVEAVQKLAQGDLWLDRVNSVKGLGKVSNDKLLRLHTLLEDAKKRFGSRQKLIDSILELEKRTKDKGYAERLAAFPLPRLLDLPRRGREVGEEERGEGQEGEKPVAKKAEKKAAAPKAEKKAAEKKPAAKAPAKKAAAKKSQGLKSGRRSSRPKPLRSTTASREGFAFLRGG